MSSDYFVHKDLILPPVKRAAYSDRTAWMLAEISRAAYIMFENNKDELVTVLKKADFELVQIFNNSGTQAFLAKRETDLMLVLAFRGTEVESPEDIVTDLNSKFYVDKSSSKIHAGFQQAFELVKQVIQDEIDRYKEYALYVTGHSLGGALALIATRYFNSDNLAACYTYGSPRVGNEEFGDSIKPPIYRVVNAYDPVPFSPPSFFLDLLALIPNDNLQKIINDFRGYTHHGDVRYLSACDDCKNVKVMANPDNLIRLYKTLRNRKNCIKDHAIDAYSRKLAEWALKRSLNSEGNDETH